MLPLISPTLIEPSSNLIRDGDLVIVYENVNTMKAITVSAKSRYDSKFGTFQQKFWIGKEFGSKVCAQSGSRGYVYLLRPSPELWTQVLLHRTQILYVADISLVCLHLELRPGAIVLESGTGSGSLTHSLARAVAPHGHVHTFEFHPGRAKEAEKEFSEHGLSELITVQQRNIEELGFPTEYLTGKADALFLDLPSPYKVVENAALVLKPNGRFCSFSPCIEQIQRTRDALVANGFVDVECLEVLMRMHDVHTERFDLMGADDEGDEGGVVVQGREDEKLEAKEEEGAGRGEEDAQQEGAQQENAEEEGAEEEEIDETRAVKRAKTEKAEGGEKGQEEEEGKKREEVEGAKEEGGVIQEKGTKPREEENETETSTEQKGEQRKRVKRVVVDVGMESDKSCEEKEGVQMQSEGIAKEEEQKQKAQGEEKARKPTSPLVKKIARRWETFVTSKPAVEARGHTGYLLFARKFL